MDIKSSIFVEEEEFPWNETSLQTFKKIINDQGIKCRTDDIFLLGFLRATDYHLEKSIEMLKNYYNSRMDHPQIFKDLLPSKLEHVLSANYVQFLPKFDQKGRYIVVWQIKDWDTSVCNFTDLYRANFLHADLQLNFHRTQVNGVVAIINAEGLSLSHFLEISPGIINSIVSTTFKDSYQLRFMEIHYVNVNVILKALLSVFIPLLPSKFRNMIHVHLDMKTLHEFVCPESLPSEYGGKLSSYDPTESNKMIKANEEFFRKNEEYVKLYEKERNKNLNEESPNTGEEDEKRKKFIAKCEEKFKRYSQDPEGYLASLQQDPDCQIRHF